MKPSLIALLAFVSSLAVAAPFSPGHWKLADAKCSNPAYVPTEEEKAFVAAVKSGATLDIYRFSDEAKGEYETQYQGLKARCIGRSTLEVEYLSRVEARLKFGAMTWKSVSEDPNVTITCGGNEKPHDETSGFEVQGDELTFLYPPTEKCGAFRMIWRKIR